VADALRRPEVRLAAGGVERLLALTFYIQSYLILRDLARVRREEAVR